MATKAGTLQISLEMQVAALRKDIQQVNREISKGTKQWSDTVSGFASGLKSAFGIAAVGTVITTALSSARAAVTDMIDEMSKINDGAAALGVTIEDFQKLGYAAEQNGIAIDTMNSAIGRMQKTIGQAEAGSKSAKKGFDDLGISIEDIADKGAIEQIATIADELAKIESPSQRAAAGAEIFGKAYQGLAPILNQGGDAIRKAAADAERLNLTYGEDAVKAADALGDSLNDLNKQGKVLISQFFGPIFAEMNRQINQTDKSTKGINNFQQGLRAAGIVLGYFGRQIAQSIAIMGAMVTGFQTVLKALGNFVRAVIAAGEAVGGVWDALFDGGDVEAAVNNAKTKMGEVMDATLQVMKASVAPAMEVWKQITAPPAALPTGTGNGPGEGDGDDNKGKGVAAAKKATEEIDKMKEATDAGAEGLKFLNDQVRAHTKAIMDDFDAMQPLRDAMEELEVARMEAAGATQYEIDMMLAYGDAQAEMIAGIRAQTAAVDEAAEAAKQRARDNEDAAKDLIDAAFDIGEAFARSSEEGQAALKDLIKQILIATAKAWLLKTMLGGAGGGGGGGGAMPFAMPSVQGLGATSYGGVPVARAANDPNAIVSPLNQGIPFTARGLQRDPMRIEVNNYGAQVDVQQQDDVIRIVIDATRNALAGDVASGGNAIASAMERTYGLRR